MGSDGGAEAFDPIGAGIRQGLQRAESAELPVRDVYEAAFAIVDDALRRSKHRLTAEQTVLLAEFVTLNLTVGMTQEDIKAWVIKVCGKWGQLSGGGGHGAGTDDRPGAGA